MSVDIYTHHDYVKNVPFVVLCRAPECLTCVQLLSLVEILMLSLMLSAYVFIIDKFYLSMTEFFKKECLIF